ncbi:RNA dependent RNA polymerase [Microcoleus sp. D3_18a_C4]|uniref:RNA dependent RNA polymerase n=1 Tax=Microcoleus sp. D3_18a_C4 TaxID=3055332 RepID=UPI002FD4D9D1
MPPTPENPKERFTFTYNLIALGSAAYGDRLIRIKSTSKFGVWNGKQKQWMHKTQPDGTSTARLSEVVYKNIMLSQLHPDMEFSICAIPIDSTVDETKLLDDYENFSLDLAGGARKHGHFLFTRKKEEKGTVGQFYFPPEKSAMGRINYGSISLSESKALFCLDNAKILVVPDLKLTNNRPDDDYENEFGTGDAHGKIDSSLLVELLDGIAGADDRVPVQFRLSIPGNENTRGIWGKGTVAPLPANKMQGYDLILPESCFKTFKPAMGANSFTRVNLAVLGEAQERKASGGTQIWSWFPIDIIETEVIPPVRSECLKIVEAINVGNIYGLIKLFKPERDLAELVDVNLVDKWFNELREVWASGSPEDETDDHAEPYAPVLNLILENDKAKILERHPYVLGSIQRSLKKKWTRLAINGATHFNSYMAMPDDALPDMTFSCKHLKAGKHITFRYPVRHWGDIQIWDCVKKGGNDSYQGVFFVSHVTFGGTGELNEAPYGQGGDFDGDYGDAIAASKLPLVAAEVQKWQDDPDSYARPKVIKAPKSPIQDTLKQVALRSMDNLTGLVASQIMHAQAKGLTNVVIPDGSGRTVLEVLSQALQDEVDRFKNDLARDTKALALVGEILNEGAKKPVWQTDYKNREAYLSRTMNVGDETIDPDPISHMIREVNFHWKDVAERLPKPLPLNSEKFRNLFGKNPIANNLVTQEQIDFARRQQAQYYQRLLEAIAVSNKDENSAISRLMKHVKEVRKDLEDRLKKSQLSEEEAQKKLLSWATAYWWVAHNERIAIDHALGKASFPFLLFPDLIAEQLLRERYDFSIYGFQHDSLPSIRERLPITQKTNAVLLGTYNFIERRSAVPDLDSKGRVVMVNGAGWIALRLKDIDFVDNDGTVYAFIRDGQIFTIKGVLLLDRLLESNQYVYLRKDGSLRTSYERPHQRVKRVVQKEDTVSVKLKNGLSWINAGIAVRNSTSIEYGQVINAEIISTFVQTKNTWSLNTVDVTVIGATRKWYIISPTKTYPASIPPGEYEARLSVSVIQMQDKDGAMVDRLLVSCTLPGSDSLINLGILANRCVALTLGISVRARLKYNPSDFREILFSPF